MSTKHGQTIGREEIVIDIWTSRGPRSDASVPTTSVRLQYVGDELWLVRKHPDGQWVTVRKATAEDERAFTHFPETPEMQIARLTRDLAAAREELAAITEHVITSMYGFAPVDSGSQLSGAVKSICDERDELRAQLAAANATGAQCKAAGFIDEQGNVRKVLGDLCITTDGAIVGDMATVYFEEGDDDFICEWDVSGAGDHIPVGVFYSTPTAAEAAREGKGHK